MDKDRKYLHSATVAALVPLLQAFITGLLLGLLVLILALALHRRDAWTWCGVVFALAMAGTWIQAQRRWHSMTGLQLVQDEPIRQFTNVIPTPEILVRISEDHGHQVTRATLPATLAQMQDLAAGLLAGQPFAERGFCGYGKPFSINGFRSLRAELVKRGLLAMANPKDPRQGYVMTVVGRQTMRAFIQDDPSPIEPAELVQL